MHWSDASGELQIWMANVPLSFGHRRNWGQKTMPRDAFSHLSEALVHEYIGMIEFHLGSHDLIDFSLISDLFLMNALFCSKPFCVLIPGFVSLLFTHCFPLCHVGWASSI